VDVGVNVTVEVGNGTVAVKVGGCEGVINGVWVSVATVVGTAEGAAGAKPWQDANITSRINAALIVFII
jgi:hypothetical protein